MPTYCVHSRTERNQLGWDIVDGLAVCRSCSLPTAQSVQARDAGQPVSSYDDTVAERATAAAAARAAARAQQTGVPRTLSPVEASRPVLIVTTNDVPGHTITAVHGDVFG